MSNDTEVENARARFTEVCNLARHYSTLRFVMFSVFITISSALVALEFDSSRRPANGAPLFVFRLASFLLVASFAVSEFRIGQLVRFYQEKTYSFKDGDGCAGLTVDRPHGHACWRIAAPWLTSAPFVLVEIMWLLALICLHGAALWPSPTSAFQGVSQ